jgi:hypothetical protein
VYDSPEAVVALALDKGVYLSPRSEHFPLPESRLAVRRCAAAADAAGVLGWVDAASNVEETLLGGHLLPPLEEAGGNRACGKFVTF